MSATDRRLDRLYPSLTARERAVLVLQAYKEDRQPEPLICSTLPADQAPGIYGAGVRATSPLILIRYRPAVSGPNILRASHSGETQTQSVGQERLVQNSREFLTVYLIYAALAFFCGMALIAVDGHWRRWRDGVESALVLSALTLAGACTLIATGSPWALLPLCVTVVVTLAAHLSLRNYSAPGRLLLLTNAQLIIVGLAWGITFIATIPVSTLTRALLFAGYPLLVLTLPAGLVSTFESWEVLCRRSWRRPRSPLPPRSGGSPKVSLHVPICSEPPEIVIATLDALAALRYPHIEVLVVDNNTADSRLWQPVEEHCRRLGDRFRFFHVDRLSGAKAGALNFARRRTAQDAEVIGVIDADYIAEADFLLKTVGYFDDPRLGFVQTPHAYRDWEGDAYLRACHWEYKYFFDTTMVSLNERDAAITVGTMCLIRRRALDEAGGWAEWCLTEDSELAIRIHALGYTSVYLNTTFGRGLIPATFAGYKRQRFRWTYGPVQEFTHHLRLLLPRPVGRRSQLTAAQKLHHLNHGLDRANIGLGLLTLPLGAGVIASMLWHREVIHVPLALWLTATVVLAADFGMKWLLYRAAIGCRSLRDIVGALIASRALSHTIAVASLMAVLKRDMPWRRTDKSNARPEGVGVLAAVRTELCLGLAIVLFVVAALLELPRGGLVLMLAIGALYQALNYLAAPAMALVAEAGVRRRQRSARKLAVAGAEARLD